MQMNAADGSMTSLAIIDSLIMAVDGSDFDEGCCSLGGGKYIFNTGCVAWIQARITVC